ncbi:MAG TPA: cyclin-dependent kinase inhibitor 3 family protein [Anaeromyxobacteraceae bacterium]|nr:cyclin-dependent kinase inhibitor 3 family protein [Anaeromyxobacteraceae bacterium]
MWFGSALHVDFLPQRAHGLPGRLGLTAAPGRWWPGRDPDPEAQLDRDLARLRDRYRAGTVVTLMEPLELRARGLDRLPDEVRRAGMESLWLPVPDLGAPPSMEAARALVGQILERMERRQVVVVHCLGGLGRSGTIAACVLAARGRTPEQAVEVVRRARPGAVQTEAQEAFVAAFPRGSPEVPGRAAPGRR